MKQGKISYKYLEALRYKASRLSQVPDEQYKKIFEEYAYSKAKTPEEAESLLSSILDRKGNILQNIEQLYNGIYNEWSKNKYSQIIQGKFKITDNITYRNSKFVYILKILEYKLNHTIIVRAIRKAIRLLKS